MVPEERIHFLHYLWDREDPFDPETWQWRYHIGAEELALVKSWDQAYVQGVGTLAEDILALEERR